MKPIKQNELWANIRNMTALGKTCVTVPTNMIDDVFYTQLTALGYEIHWWRHDDKDYYDVYWITHARMDLN